MRASPAPAAANRLGSCFPVMASTVLSSVVIFLMISFSLASFCLSLAMMSCVSRVVIPCFSVTLADKSYRGREGNAWSRRCARIR